MKHGSSELHVVPLCHPSNPPALGELIHAWLGEEGTATSASLAARRDLTTSDGFLVNDKGRPFSESSFSMWVRSIVRYYTGAEVGVRDFRHAVSTFVRGGLQGDGNEVGMATLEHMARAMRHSL